MFVKNVMKIMDRKAIYRVLFFAVLMMILLLIYILCKNVIEMKQDKEREEKIYENIYAEIVDVNREEERLEIFGWISYENAESNAVKVAVRSSNEANISIYPCEMTTNQEIEAYYNVKDNKNGFKAFIERDFFDADKSYEILLIVEYEDFQGVTYKAKLSTEQYIYNGKLYRYNPLTFFEPNVEEQNIREAIEQGMILECDIENGIWIYDYLSDIYVIVDYQLMGELHPSPAVVLEVYNFSDGTGKLEESKSEYLEYYLTDKDVARANESKFFTHVFKTSVAKSNSNVSVGIYGNLNGTRTWLQKYNVGLLGYLFENSK